MKRGSLLLIVLLCALCLRAQNVGAGTSRPDTSALLDADHIDVTPQRGLLVPRMTTAQRDSLTGLAYILFIYNTTTNCLEFWDGSNWLSLQPCASCMAPMAPAAGSHTNTQTSVTWNWKAVSGATGYRVNTKNYLGTATNIGNVTSYTQTGLTCGTNYTLYVWAQNTCGISTASKFTYNTAVCVPVVTCGSQVFMQQNMDVGTMINDPAHQSNDSQVEKYCYNNTPANCATYGGVYQWAEALGEPFSSNNIAIDGTWQTCDPCGGSGRQGICPSGYHVPTDLEWSRYEWCIENNVSPAGTTPLTAFQTGLMWRGITSSTAGPGAKLKAGSNNTLSWEGTNVSGFTALPAGYRYKSGGFYYLGSVASFWTAKEIFNGSAWYRHLDTGYWQSGRYAGSKLNGLSVRCLQN